MPITKNCEHCQTPYTRVPALAKESRFCSKKCSHEWRRENFKNKALNVKCRLCDATFQISKDNSKKKLYCSRECYFSWKTTADCRLCTKCKESKPVSEFSKNPKNQKAGYNQWCKDCHSLYLKAHNLKPHIAYKIKADTECAGCNRVFHQEVRTKDKLRKYCTRQCCNLSVTISKNCPSCNKTFGAHRLVKNKIYCSRECRPNPPCQICEKPLLRFGQKTCSQDCASVHRMLRSSKKGIVPQSFSNTIRRFGELLCERCGFKNVAALIVHHKDRNRENNSDGNLETLCANCHAIEHYQGTPERERLVKVAHKRARLLPQSVQPAPEDTRPETLTSRG